MLCAVNLLDLLREIQKRQGGFFQVSTNKSGAEWDGEYGFFALDTVDTEAREWWFTNRLYPTRYLNTRKASAALPIRFVRIDLELPDHDLVPSATERKLAHSYGVATNAVAGVDTPHGVHLYYLLKNPIPDSALKPFVLDRMAGYTGEMVADTPSWNPACLSRYVDKLAFYTGKEVAWVAPVPAPKPNKPEGKLTKSYLYGRVKLAKVVALRNAGFPDIEICKATGVGLDELRGINASEYGWNAGDNAPCYTPLGPSCLRRGLEQNTYKVFADRWWGYQSMRYCGVTDEEDILLLVQYDETFQTVRNVVASNFKLSGNALLEWLRVDVRNHFLAFPNGYTKKKVSGAKVKAIKALVDNRARVRTKAITGFSRFVVARAMDELGYVSEKVGKVWYWVKAPKHKNNETVPRIYRAPSTSGVNRGSKNCDKRGQDNGGACEPSRHF